MRKNTINGENDFVLTTETIVSIKRAKPGQVFNISVADDESYVANGIIVHNCRSRIVAYPYDYPGDRDFTKQTDGTKVTKKYGKSIDAQVTNFRTKYWKPAKVEIPVGATPGIIGISSNIITVADGISRIGRFVNIDSMSAVHKKITSKYPTGVALNGANLDILKAINEGLERSIGKYSIILNHVGWQKAGGKTAALYGQAGTIERGIYTKIQFQKTATKNAFKSTKKSNTIWASNHKYKIEQIDKSLSNPDISEKYKTILLRDKEKLGYSIRWDVGCDVDNPLVATTIHEGYHAIMMQNSLIKSWKTNLQKEGILTMRDNRIFGVSDYATTNYDELWAEVGTAIELNVKIPIQFKKAYAATIKEVI
jgi:hypothetical protein